jgi:hypothetical protein
MTLVKFEIGVPRIQALIVTTTRFPSVILLTEKSCVLVEMELDAYLEVSMI